MESEIARIAWQMEALAAELEPPTEHRAPVPTPISPRVPVAIPYPQAAQNWFANVMQAGAMGMDPIAANREVVLFADAVQRALGGMARRLGELERRALLAEHPGDVAPAVAEVGAASAEEPPAPAAPFDLDALVGGIAQELDLLDAKLEECKTLQTSVIEVGGQLNGLGERLDRLERTSDEHNPLLEALVESAARFQLLDAKLDASLANASDLTRLVERLEAERAGNADAPGSTELVEGEPAGETGAYLAVLEDLPFDDSEPEGASERWGFLRKSTP